jgi:amino acid transporter
VRLKANVIGPWGLTALVIGVTSPAIGLFAMRGPIEATTGPFVPLVFLGALAIILPTVLSYASLNRHAPSAGAAASWLWATVNPSTGFIAGLVMMTYFVMTAIGSRFSVGCCHGSRSRSRALAGARGASAAKRPV